jgi:hypothetical protein
MLIELEIQINNINWNFVIRAINYQHIFIKSSFSKVALLSDDNVLKSPT